MTWPFSHQAVRFDEMYRFVLALRLGIVESFFSVPPSLANRLPHSLAIRASRPSFTRDVFSLMPVSSAALRIRSSSMLIVVLMRSLFHDTFYGRMNMHGIGANVEANVK
jgi:hypothetical protein